MILCFQCQLTCLHNKFREKCFVAYILLAFSEVIQHKPSRVKHMVGYVSSFKLPPTVHATSVLYFLFTSSIHIAFLTALYLLCLKS